VTSSTSRYGTVLQRAGKYVAESIIRLTLGRRYKNSYYDKQFIAKRAGQPRRLLDRQPLPVIK
jgi:hypothetical protein